MNNQELSRQLVAMAKELISEDGEGMTAGRDGGIQEEIIENIGDAWVKLEDVLDDEIADATANQLLSKQTISALKKHRKNFDKIWREVSKLISKDKTEYEINP